MSFEGVPAKSSCLFWGNKNLHCPRVSRSSGGTAPAIQVLKKRETLLLGSRNARPRPIRFKNRHFGCFCPKTLGPPTPARKRAPGLIRRSAERPPSGAPPGSWFPGPFSSRKPVPLPFEGVPERFLVSCQRLASPDKGVRKGFPGSSECRSGVFRGSPCKILLPFLGSKNLHCPCVSRSSGRTAPLIQVSKNAKRFSWALEMPGRG